LVMRSLGGDAINGCSSGRLKASMKDCTVFTEPLAPEVSGASRTTACGNPQVRPGGDLGASGGAAAWVTGSEATISTVNGSQVHLLHP
jgi:hypothetical protein